MDGFHPRTGKKACTLDFDNQPYRYKDAATFGMSNSKLKEKAVAEDPNMDTLVKWGQARETGREDAHTLKDNTTVSRVNRLESTSELDMDSDGIEQVMQTLKVMKLQKQGCYSSCY